MRKLLGGFLVVIASVGLALGGLWAYAKAAGAEVDICPQGKNCISGWYFAVPILVGALAVGALGVGLIRSQRDDSRSGEPTT